RARGKLDEAEEMISHAAALLRLFDPKDVLPETLGLVWFIRGSVQMDYADYRGAEASLRRALAEWDRSAFKEIVDHDRARAMSHLANVLNVLGKDGAEALCLKALGLLERLQKEEFPGAAVSASECLTVLAVI